MELSGEDASRADPDFLKAVYADGVDAGADRLCFCDTVGLLVPERTTEIFRSIFVPELSKFTATTISGQRLQTRLLRCGGGKQAHVTING